MVRKVAFYGVFASLAIIVAVIERQFPLPIPIFGIKLGLPNVVVIMVMYALNARAAVSISVLRVLLVNMIFGTMTMAIFGLAGALASFVVMFIAMRVRIFGLVGVSVLGSVAHIVAQSVVGAFWLNTPDLILTYMPIMIISGVVTGVLIGYTAGFALQNLKIINRPNFK